MHRVTTLTPTEFEEEMVTVIEAAHDDRLPVGPHTLTVLGDGLILVDARRTRFIWAAFVAFLRIWARNTAARARRS